MLTGLAAFAERVRSSLFFVPMICVIGGALLAETMLLVDAGVTGIDPRLTATVDSARTVLTTVAQATLSFAAIAFSVSLLLISLASSQYSPRVVHGMFRDPFNKRVMGLVIGTFTYCLVVLRAVRSPLQASGDPVVPSISILLAVVLGIASILAIVAFINHAAHSMDVSKILHRVTGEALVQADKAWPEPEPDSGSPQQAVAPNGLQIAPDAVAVRFTDHGWVQQVDYARLLAALPAGSRSRLDTFAGRYAVQNTPICHVWPPPVDDGELDRAVRASVSIGQTRSLHQDVAYGVRQLADVALKALSPGINDPTTAHDAMCHIGSLLADLLGRLPPPQFVVGEQDQVLLLPLATTHEHLVGIAFDEVRLASAGQPTALVNLLDVLHQVEQSLAGLDRPSAVAALRSQADMIVAMADECAILESDRARVRDVYEQFTQEGPI